MFVRPISVFLKKDNCAITLYTYICNTPLCMYIALSLNAYTLSMLRILTNVWTSVRVEKGGGLGHFQYSMNRVIVSSVIPLTHTIAHTV